MSASRPALDLVEGAVQLLLRTPARIHAVFLLGSAPFALALLASVVDLGFGAAITAVERNALLLTVLYLLMKVAHGAYARGLHATALSVPDDAAAGSRTAAIVVQMCWQPWGLWLQLVATLAVIPAAWTYAFFHALELTGGRRDAVRAAVRIAAHAPLQNHAALAILSICSSLAFVNAWVTLVMTPFLLRALVGVETLATLDPRAMLNSTVVAGAVLLAYLASAPLARAITVLRAIEAESTLGGEDLLAELRRLRVRQQGTRALLAGVLVLAGGLASTGSRAAEAPEIALEVAPTIAPGIAPEPAPEIGRLNVELDRVLAQPDFVWRDDPRWEPTEGTSLLAGFWEALYRAASWFGEVVDRIVEYLRILFERRSPSADPAAERSSTPGWRVIALLIAMAALIALTALIGAVAAWRARRRRTAASALPGSLTSPSHDLEDHDAARLPSDEWLRLASELEAAGDLRAAARAVHLATLSQLARGGLVALAPTKTNRDYHRELGYRALAQPLLIAAYADTVARVEPVWWGTHPAGDHLLAALRGAFAVVSRELLARQSSAPTTTPEAAR